MESPDDLALAYRRIHDRLRVADGQGLCDRCGCPVCRCVPLPFDDDVAARVRESIRQAQLEDDPLDDDADEILRKTESEP